MHKIEIINTGRAPSLPCLFQLSFLGKSRPGNKVATGATRVYNGFTKFYLLRNVFVFYTELYNTIAKFYMLRNKFQYYYNSIFQKLPFSTK